ncbi:MAG: hypothetical protein NW241_19065 [Bacteroidia bacterium]|nr:hypothetical protein [Bacteroidia bacterium]
MNSCMYLRTAAGMLLLLLAACGLPLQAQQQPARDPYPPGYIVSARGDTTTGYVRSGNRFRDQQYIRFYDLYGARSKYHADRIRAYGYEDRHYESMPTPYLFSGLFSDSSIFLLRKVQGPACLFRFYTRRSILTLKGKPAFIELIRKPDGSLHEAGSAFKWKRVADAFPDYPELADDIRNGLYKPSELSQIVEAYNRWYLRPRE